MQKTKRLLAMLMALAMILALLPVFASAADGVTLYLTPNSNWTSANARFAIYTWNSSGGQKWVSMTAVPGETNLYQGTIPSGYNNVIFVRLNPANNTNDWGNKWNQTADLVYDGTKNHCTIKAGQWDCGTNVTWSVYTPPVAVPEWNSPVVSGDSVTFNYWSSENLSSVEVRGSFNDWTADAAHMTKGADGIWSVTISGLYNGQYEYKFVTNGSNWINDPKNTGAKVGDNNAFTITDSIDWLCDVILHYQDTNSWPQVHAYIWTGADNILEPWPGQKMDVDMAYTGWYTLPIYGYTQNHMNVIFSNGLEGDEASQTLDLSITDLAEGYNELWYVDGQFLTEAPENYTKQQIEVCDVTVHFKDTLGWGQYGPVSGYSWTNTWPATYPSEVWPGTMLTKIDGWYTMELTSVPYVVGDGVYVIFNIPGGEGYLQTMDLQIPCDGQQSVEVWIQPTGEQTEYMSYICEMFYEEPRVIANVGGQDYYTLADALANANGQLITLVGDNYTPTTIEADVTIDLAGWKLDEITVADGCALTLIDTKNDDYTLLGGVAYVKGNVNTLACVDGKNYVTVLVDGQYTAHRYDFSISHITLDAGNDALGFRATLKGDWYVQAAVTGYGFNMGAQVFKEYSNTVEAGQFNSEFTLRLKGIMAAGGADMDIFATAFVTLAGQTITTAQESTTMHKTVEAINDLWNIAGFNATQKAAVKALLNAYYSITQHWNLDKINDSIVDIPIS